MSPASAPSKTLPESFFGTDCELALLLACLSNNWTPECNIVGQLEAGIDWQRFLDEVDRHGVLPHVYKTLMQFSHLVPADIACELQKRFTEHVRRALWLTQLLRHVIAALGQADIASLPFKGPVLAQRLYGDVAMRQFSDLDLFVRPDDLASVKKALKKIGFVPHANLRHAEESALLASGYELGFDGMGNRNLIEIQWRVLPRFYSIDFQVEDFFSRTQVVDAGGKFETVCDEDLVLVLCAHAAKHAWAKLCWTHDIAQLSTAPGIHWAGVAESAGALGIRRIVGTSFYLAQEMFGAVIPPEIESIARDDPEVRMVGTHIIQRMSSDFDLDPESIAYFRLMLKVREQVRDRIRFVTRLVTTPTITEWSLVRLPIWLFPLYRVVRIFRLIARMHDRRFEILGVR